MAALSSTQDTTTDVARTLARCKFSPRLPGLTKLVSKFGKEGCWRKALGVYESLHILNIVPDTAITNAAISACDKGGQWQKSLELFHSMAKRGLQRDAITYSATISSLAKGKQFGTALQCFEHMQANNIEADVVTCCSLINALEKGGQWQLAEQVFLQMCISVHESEVALHGMLQASGASGLLGTGGMRDRALLFADWMHVSLLFVDWILCHCNVKLQHPHHQCCLRSRQQTPPWQPPTMPAATMSFSVKAVETPRPPCQSPPPCKARPAPLSTRFSSTRLPSRCSRATASSAAPATRYVMRSVMRTSTTRQQHQICFFFLCQQIRQAPLVQHPAVGDEVGILGSMLHDLVGDDRRCPPTSPGSSAVATPSPGASPAGPPGAHLQRWRRTRSIGSAASFSSVAESPDPAPVTPEWVSRPGLLRSVSDVPAAMRRGSLPGDLLSQLGKRPSAASTGFASKAVALLLAFENAQGTYSLRVGLVHAGILCHHRWEQCGSCQHLCHDAPRQRHPLSQCQPHRPQPRVRQRPAGGVRACQARAVGQGAC